MEAFPCPNMDNFDNDNIYEDNDEEFSENKEE